MNEAAWLLVERIDFQAKSFDSKISLGRWTSHPAREALVKLGRSADREILAKAQRPQSESRLEQMAIVLKAHYGKQQALEEVRETIEDAETAEAKTHLARLREALQVMAE